jgi:beta-xylosidase/AraC-like DNA-binding protein
MICEKTEFKFGLPIKVSLNSLSKKMKFNRSFKLIWVLNGKISLKSRNFKKDCIDIFKLKSGEMQIINSYTPYKLLEVSSESKYFVLDFKNDFIYENENYNESKVFYLNNNNQESLKGIKYLTSLIIHDYFKLDYDLFDKIEKNLNKLIEKLNNNYCIHTQRNDDFYLKQKENIVNKVIKKLENNYKEKLTLKKIASDFHYNSSYLSEKFKSLTGVNFKSYLDQIKLEKILTELLYTNKNINQIALEAGFRNIKSFYRVFNEQFVQSPIELKNNFPKLKREEISQQFGEIDHLIDYLNEFILAYENDSQEQEQHVKKEIGLDSNRNYKDLNHIWQKLINAGTAQSILDSNLRKQIKELQQEINFEYLRFEGIFNDDLEVCKGDSLENIHYNWKLVDNIFDFVLENNFRPFVTLSFMPKLLASKDKTIFYYQANFSPPKDINAWLDLIDAFLIHLINRYGIEEVQKWYFQIWTEFPHQGFHWSGTEEEYFNFYAETAKKIKDISQSLKVGPASESFFESNFISEKFLEYAANENLPLDFYNINLYHNSIPEINEEVDLTKFYKESTLENIKFKFKAKDYSIKIAKKIRKLLNQSYSEAELIATRWNVSWNSKEYVHDTAFMANFILDNALKLQDTLDGLGYLNISDLISEWPINELPFFGGRGLMNTEGIKKSGYYAYIILSELGNKIIAQGKNYIISARGEDIQILLYNYAYFNKSYQNADYSKIDEHNRYQVFKNKKDILFELKLKNITGRYKMSHYFLNRDSGSAFDQWLKMGSPPDLNKHEVKYLKNKAFPDLKVEYLNLENEYNIKAKITKHGSEFFILRKQFQI